MHRSVWKSGVRLPDYTLRQIAASLDRAPSTVAREVKRNSGTQLGYQARYAQQQSQALGTPTYGSEHVFLIE